MLGMLKRHICRRVRLHSFQFPHIVCSHASIAFSIHEGDDFLRERSKERHSDILRSVHFHLMLIKFPINLYLIFISMRTLSKSNLFYIYLKKHVFFLLRSLQNILEKFNPGARQLISAGKAYLKALHGEYLIGFCERFPRITVNDLAGGLTVSLRL